MIIPKSIHIFIYRLSRLTEASRNTMVSNHAIERAKNGIYDWLESTDLYTEEIIEALKKNCENDFTPEIFIKFLENIIIDRNSK